MDIFETISIIARILTIFSGILILITGLLRWKTTNLGPFDDAKTFRIFVISFLFIIYASN